jgi:signal transduction histidine kinase
LAVVATAYLHRVHHPWLAVAAIALTGAVTVAATAVLKDRDPAAALRPRIVAVEVAVAVAVVAADGWVQQGRLTGQTLAGSWPIPSILVAALAGGVLWGVGTAILLGAARSLSVAVSGWTPGQGGRAAVAVASTAIEWIAFGAVAAIVIHLLRQTRQQLAEAEVRERMARDLHDGVLQTLTLIERRSSSPEIAKLARDQERDLRSYLFGDYRSSGTLGAALRSCAARFEESWPGAVVTVTVTADVASVSGSAVDAVIGAVTEALNNAAKHGGATRIVLFADVDETTGGLFVTVKDDGCGFDPASVTPGVGMSQSIRDRVERHGGQVDFATTPGDGVEVRIRVP